MSPRAKKTIGWSLFLLLLVPVGGGALAGVDARYVKAGAYRVERVTDSLNLRHDLKEIRAELARTDSTLRVILDLQREIRACLRYRTRC